MTRVRPVGRATEGLLPLVPHRLHGREDERRALQSAFKRVRRGGAEVVLLTGPAGIGKSALAEEFGRSAGERGAVFARGWFDPFHSTPLSGFRHALGQALAAHKEQPGANRVALRELLQDRLGDGVGVIARLVPGLERVVGAIPEPNPAPASDEQNRFRLMTGRFISALASADRPLVVLLDDLQWAEPSSVELLIDLIRTHSIDHALFLGGFRCEQDGGDHPLLRLAADPPADAMPLRRITLDTLDRRASRALVADALQSDSATVAPLSDAVSQATGGNPLALLRFLGVLRDQAVLRDGDGTSGWAWDMQQVEQQALGRGSRILLERVTDRLPEPTRASLEAAACLASEFSAIELARGRGTSVADTVMALQPAVTQHLLRIVGDSPAMGSPTTDRADLGYRFAHERIRQSLYERMPRDVRGLTHRELGQRLMAAWQHRGTGPLLFDAADQLLRATELEQPPAPGRDVAELFAAAGEKANRTAAWHQAVTYLEAALGCLPTEGDVASLVWRLRSALATAYPMCGRVEDCERILDAAAGEAADLGSQLEVCTMRIRTRVLDNRYEDAVHSGLDGLALLDHALPPLQDVAAWTTPTESEALGMASLMSDLSLEQLAHRPEMADDRALAELALLGEMLAPAYLFPHVLSWAITRAVNLCLEHGNGPQAPFVYAMQGMLCCIGGDTAVGGALGRIALELVESRDDQAQAPPVTLLFVNFIDHYSQPLEDGFARGRAAIEIALEQGLFQYAGWLAMNTSITQFIRGEPLAKLVDQSVDLYRMARDTARYEDAANFLAAMLHVVADLAGRIDVTRLLAERGATPAEVIPALAHYSTAAVNASLGMLVGAVVKGDKRAARELIGPIREGLGALMGLPEPAEFLFFESLVLADEYGTADPDRQGDIIGRIEANLAELRVWNERCPANHAHKLPFLEAELQVLRGEDPVAAYGTAAELAAARRYQHFEGLAWERRATFLRTADRHEEASEDRERALAAYQRWGALAKVNALESS